MSNRSSGVKLSQQRQAQKTERSVTDMAAGIAAKEADIKAFNELLGERKRLNERLTEQSGLEGQVQEREKSAQCSETGAELAVNSLFNQRRFDNNGSSSEQREGGNIGLAGSQSNHLLKLSLNSNDADSSLENAKPKPVDSIVEVVQRIVLNHVSNKDPKQWKIKLDIDGQQLVEVTIEYRGEQNWCLGFSRGKNSNDSHSDSGLPPDLDNLDQLYLKVKSGLKTLQPELQLSEIKIKTGLG